MKHEIGAEPEPDADHGEQNRLRKLELLRERLESADENEKKGDGEQNGG
ncbi:hypothetical protein Tasa_034_016 [Tanticharoenia sakaeratensis NBRC 103193]|uniref:Uncharacterized protein n=1 Tax=Tanticharoenia sakaeratensis NBRC 103193 TaxID=1231623 RepID=A0A0D6MMN0_9PROT|nr:hypothetical protein Tasa_034_016 [Tanticharoenia sakaeratensis NBRC 103193]GBQ22508.1 hypothetical protein AA103193_2091 [Tanticharoenia sakaeratensis NBRC 103193]